MAGHVDHGRVDVRAEVDLNLAMNSDGQIIELQATGEKATFSREQLDRMLELGSGGIRELLELQQQAIAPLIGSES